MPLYEYVILNDDGSTAKDGVLFHDLRGGGGAIAFTSSSFDTAKETTSAWLLLARRGDRCPAGGPARKPRFPHERMGPRRQHQQSPSGVHQY